MRRNKRRMARLAAVVLAIGAATTPVAAARTWSERAGDIDPQTECALWSKAMADQLALYGITGAQASSYLAQRLDNPCHAPITQRSLFHAGDPGA